MGLALHSPPPDSIFLHRHLPPEPPRASRRHRGRDGHLRTVLERPMTGDDCLVSRVEYVRRRQSHSVPRRRGHHVIPCVLDSDDEVIRLARSNVPLPSDGSRNRVPSLERQNAFRDASTVKSPPTRSLSQGCEAEDPEVAELYRLGLLYDDEHVRGSGFNFNAIARDEPTYTMKTRPTRRSRRVRDDAVIKIPMDWSFPGLEEDDEVARYLVDSSRASKPNDNDTPRRGYRMVWRSAPAVNAPQDTPTPDKDAPASDRDTNDISASFASLHRSTYSDFIYDSDDDEMDWAVLSPGGDKETTTVDAATGTWVVLGDGS